MQLNQEAVSLPNVLSLVEVFVLEIPAAELSKMIETMQIIINETEFTVWDSYELHRGFVVLLISDKPLGSEK